VRSAARDGRDSGAVDTVMKHVPVLLSLFPSAER
jgi:hypothetical protein